jgi:hypothetical protein
MKGITLDMGCFESTVDGVDAAEQQGSITNVLKRSQVAIICCGYLGTFNRYHLDGYLDSANFNLIQSISRSIAEQRITDI